ncbi:MAG: TonB-dependent receptor [Gammaproteobacteria bacterium]|nr:TonB-dependent receptor [Gammaproteobacteria bacterium]
MLYQKTNERCCVRSSRLFAMACLFGALIGAQTAVAADEPKEELITIGTRTEGRTALESLAPIDLITSEDMHATGATETGKQLQMAAPSFGFSSTTISDGTDIIRPATLRGMGPDQVLVLINGKRRHQQSLVNVQQTIARGSAGTDINAIPSSAIERIEVLKDGASAQYGSDAIAGVINIILKNQTDALDLQTSYGQTYDEDGETFFLGLNGGLPIGNGGFANVTLEYRDRSETNRAGRATTNLLGWYDDAEFNDPDFVPAAKLRIGDADSENLAVWWNAMLPVGRGELYTFGGYSNREGDSAGFWRGPADGRTIPDLYPDGFLPNIITEVTDVSVGFGYRFELIRNWPGDISIVYGESEFDFFEQNTANVSYWFEPLDGVDPANGIFGETATAANTGNLIADQVTINLDFNREIDWGVGAGPLNFAVGAEWRQDGYKIEPGDPVSYQYGRTNDPSVPILNQTGGAAAAGTQGFPGFQPRNAVDQDRDAVALYVDFETRFTDKFAAGIAGRWEDYDDFGSTTTGKIFGRYDFTERFGARATVSTGFRAPGIQQQFYSLISTNLNASGVLTDTITARTGDDVANAFGIPLLEEEESTSYSLGVVWQPSDMFSLTVDVYRIDVDDRIIFSSNIQNGGDPANSAIDAVFADLEAAGIVVGQAQFFTNAIDTETEGLDVVADWAFDLNNGANLGIKAIASFNDQEVSARKSGSSVISPEVLFDDAQVTLIERGQPSERFMLAGTYDRGPWTVDVRGNYFGSVAGEGFTPGCTAKWDGGTLVDLTVAYRIRDNIKISAGATNLFDEKPDKWIGQECDVFPFPELGFTYGWETLPFGINGGAYFARLDYRFNWRN